MSYCLIVTPEALRTARLRAGHTQAEAAALVRAGSYRTWQDWESGRRPIDPVRYEWYLLVTDQHPRWRLVERRSKCQIVPDGRDPRTPG